jgi:hypothetical protein
VGGYALNAMISWDIDIHVEVSELNKEQILQTFLQITAKKPLYRQVIIDTFNYQDYRLATKSTDIITHHPKGFFIGLEDPLDGLKPVKSDIWIYQKNGQNPTIQATQQFLSHIAQKPALRNYIVNIKHESFDETKGVYTHNLNGFKIYDAVINRHAQTLSDIIKR